jgi:AcrR family transcriptional regulator
MNLRVEQKQRTRSRLVEAAAELFQTKGYAATTIEDLVDRVGATRATFYLHFRTKADLVSEVMAEIRQESRALTDQLEAVVASGQRAALRSWLDDAFDFWDELRPYAAAEEEAVALDEATRRRRSDGFMAGVEPIIRGLVARDGVGRKCAHVRAVLAYAQLQGVFHRWMSVGWDIDRLEALEVMTDMWMASIMDRSANAGPPTWML